MLLAAHVPALVGHVDLNAEFRHRADSHIDIARALDGRGQHDVAVAVEQGESEKQTRDELRADVAGYFKNAAMQLAAYLQRKPALGLAGHALFGQRVGVNADRPLGQSACACKDGAHAAGRGYGYQEPQSAAALTAVKLGFFVFEYLAPVNGQHFVFKRGFSSQRLNAADSSLDVLGQRDRRNGANAPGQRGADNSAVHVAFRRRR